MKTIYNNDIPTKLMRDFAGISARFVCNKISSYL